MRTVDVADSAVHHTSGVHGQAGAVRQGSQRRSLQHAVSQSPV